MAVPISQEMKDEYYPGQAFEWEHDPVSGQNVEVPAYVDYINADGTPHINYDYWQGMNPTPPAPVPLTPQQQNLATDRNIGIYAQGGMFNPQQQGTQIQAWRPSWIQF